MKRTLAGLALTALALGAVGCESSNSKASTSSSNKAPTSSSNKAPTSSTSKASSTPKAKSKPKPTPSPTDTVLELKRWYGNFGKTTLADIVTAANSFDTDDLVKSRGACQSLYETATKAKDNPQPPVSKDTSKLWTKAMESFEAGGSECTEGLDNIDTDQIEAATQDISEGNQYLNQFTDKIKAELD